MKKLSAVLIVLMLLFAACGSDPSNGDLDTSGSNMDLVRPEIQKLMTNGNQILDDVADSYSGLTNESLKGLIKYIADRNMFPVDVSSGAPFSERMRAYLGGENNLRNALLIGEDLANGREPGSSIPGRMVRKSFARKDASYYETYFNTAGDFFKHFNPVVGGIFKTVGGIIGMFGKKKPSIEQRIKNQLNVMHKTMQAYQQENRKYFGMVLAKSDQILGDLATLAGDVNRVHGQLSGKAFMGDMTDIKDGFQGVIDTCDTAPTVTDVSNASYNYFITSSGFMTHINKFFTTASNIHKWAVDNTNLSGFSQWIGQDAATRGEKKLITTVMYDSYPGSFQGPHYYYLGFPNPKKTVMMSIGDLDYLSSMMLTRITMNVYLYIDEATLASANNLLASNFLERIQVIKASVNQAFQNIEQVRTYWNSDMGHGSNMTGANFANYCSTQYQTETGSSTWAGWDFHSSTVSSFTNPRHQSVRNMFTTLAYGGFMGKHLDEEARLARENFYLVAFTARLMALETQLKSYLVTP